MLSFDILFFNQIALFTIPPMVVQLGIFIVILSLNLRFSVFLLVGDGYVVVVKYGMCL